ncbi:hypothetical protein DAMA08_005290 [Martiniozyma asiatica (nom. inval.)]|nr:hypothetical protein DAMA08_005290 [Martiniozyma asiatica]
MEFEEYEDKTGLRFPFNVFPSNKKLEENLGIPLSCLYQPLRQKENGIILDGAPVGCSTCQGIINPFCQIDVNTGYWTCSICSARNKFAQTIPPIVQYLLSPDAIDVEFIINNGKSLPVVYLFVIDLSIDEEELESLKDSLLKAIELLPIESYVGLITFGKNIQVYQSGLFDHMSTLAFNGNKLYSKEQLSKIIDQNHQKIIQRVNICAYNLTQYIQSLTCDSFSKMEYHRKFNCSGSALNVSTKILELLFPKASARIMLFSGGPCTVGPGNIVNTDLKEPLRSHKDLDGKSSLAKKFKENVAFYNKLAEGALLEGYTYDIFIGSYDQIGLSEMESLVDKTGGVVIQSDSFTSAIFSQSLQRFFEKDEQDQSQFGLNAFLEIKSTALKISGLVGHAMSFKSPNKKIDNISERKIGHSGSSMWKLGSIFNHSTYGIYFELSQQQIPNAFNVIQFITTYQHPDGTRRVRATTSQRFFTTGVNPKLELINSFDQEAAVVLIAREAISSIMNNSTINASKLVDRALVSLLTNFCAYQQGNPQSLQIASQMTFLPQFIYHLRRSNFINIFNSSPDETSYYRHIFLTEECSNALTMIQPQLLAYELNSQQDLNAPHGPFPVLLDSTSIKPDRLLLLDTFFHILIYHGSTVAEWRRQNFHLQPEYAYLAQFLELPRKEAAEILVDRFPLPRFIDTDEGGSQARFLMSKLNPVTSYKENVNGLLTDDLSLGGYMEVLRGLIVKPTK